MFKADAIKFYGTRVKVARAAGVDPSAVSQWGELVPEKNASRLQEDSGGALIYDQSVYDQYRNEKRSGEVNHENQA